MSRGVTPASALLRLAAIAVLACLYPPILWGVAIAVAWKCWVWLWRRHPLAAIIIHGFLSGLLGGDGEDDLVCARLVGASREHDGSGPALPNHEDGLHDLYDLRAAGEALPLPPDGSTTYTSCDR